jgi:signal transduction histidine kinase/ActR/RegA family two-component response regulator
VAGFRDLPIRRKLALTTLTSTAAALLLASGGFLTWDVVQFRAMVSDDLQAQAAMISRNSAAPLEFQDERLAAEVLGTLQVRPRIALGCLYDAKRNIFASYQRESEVACPVSPPDQSQLGWRGLSVVTPVRIEEQQAGTVYVRRDFADLYDRLRVGLGAVLALLLVATWAAFLTGRGMQHLIASPLLALAETARTISATRDYSLRATAVSGDEVGLVVRAFNDMLDRMAEALERERSANRLKDEFLATLSHELRTPLNAVMGWTSMLRSGRLTAEDQAKALDTIERNARAQTRLVDDLLDMSTIVSGKPRLLAQKADLAEILDAAIDVIRPAAAAKRLLVHVDIAARPALTTGDPSRLQQIAWNILSNAVKFTPPDGHVWIKLEQHDGFRLTVRDSGPGIVPAFLPFVFSPFRQADGSPTRDHGGLGLGLAIAKQLVELHGGTIHARNAEPNGAIFDVQLPSSLGSTEVATPRPDLRPTTPATATQGALLNGSNVLIVDDDADSRVMLETGLTHHGARVTTADCVAAALAAIERHPPDILVSDIGMPNEDGYALIRRLRSDPALKADRLPAIAVTAYASMSDAMAAETAGFDAHVAKPIDTGDLARLIATLVRPTGGCES